MLRSTLLAVLFAFPGLVKAGTLRVPTEFGTIQVAIEAAVDGDIVLVAPGVYSELVNFMGKDIKLVSESGALTTTIDGTGLVEGVIVRSVVRFVSGEPATATLQGFTVRGGGGTSGDGGGVLIRDSAALLRENVFVDNQREFFLFFGGGVYVENGDGTVILNNFFVRNTVAEEGGGVYALLTDGLRIEGNVFAENRAVQTSGGGSQSGCGGGVTLGGSENARVINNLFVGNLASAPPWGLGGALFLNLSENLEFSGNTLVGNQAFLAGSAIATNGDLVIRDSIVWDNTVTRGIASEPAVHQLLPTALSVEYSNAQDGVPLGTGSFSANPLFAEGPAFGGGDLSGLASFYLSHLDAGQPADSPCVDAGGPASIPPPDATTRTDGIPDFGTADLGFHYPYALYFTIPFLRGDANGDGDVDLADAVRVLEGLFSPIAPNFECDDATDANDDGAVDISDAIRLLSFLFESTGVELPVPSSACGLDPTADSLRCLSAACP